MSRQSGREACLKSITRQGSADLLSKWAEKRDGVMRTPRSNSKSTKQAYLIQLSKVAAIPLRLAREYRVGIR